MAETTAGPITGIMKTRATFGLLLTGTLAAAASAAPATSRPNIILIVADDLGQRDLGCYNPGTFYETPNLDRFAKQSVRFTNGYAANPVCSPTRVSLQTGRYPTRTNNTYWFGAGPVAGRSFDFMPPKITDYLPFDEETLGEGLKKAGYQTAFVGKWHLGADPKYWPEKRGFDVNIAGNRMGHPHSYFSPYKNPRLPDGPKGEYLPERLTRESIALLDKMAADKSKPFFLCHCFYLVHMPPQALPELIKKYTAKAKKLGVNNEKDFGEEEQNWPEAGKRRIRTRQGNPTYAAMMEALDTSFGKLMAELDRLGVADNTLILFIGDNGGLATTGQAPTSNLPLRAGKGWLYEGGIREPFMVRWPAAIKGGVTNDTPVMSIDALPTFFAAAGAALPAKKIDGLNLLPMLENNAPLNRDALFWHFPHYGDQGGFPGAAVRIGDWKLIERFLDGRVQLFNLKADLGEQHDLASVEPERVAAMKARLHAWYKEVGAKFLQRKGPDGSEPWRPKDDNTRATSTAYYTSPDWFKFYAYAPPEELGWDD